VQWHSTSYQQRADCSCAAPNVVRCLLPPLLPPIFAVIKTIFALITPITTDDPFSLPLITCVWCHIRTTATRIWNSLPCGLQKLDISYKHFKTLLKTCLTRPRRFVTFYVSTLEILLLTYLFTYLTYFCHPSCLEENLPSFVNVTTHQS